VRFHEAHAQWQDKCRQLHERFTAAVDDHQRREQQRQQRLGRAKSHYNQECRDRVREVEEHNREIDAFAASFAARDPEAIVEYFNMVLANWVYPEGDTEGWAPSRTTAMAARSIRGRCPAWRDDLI
jgi:restriction system protein